MADQVLGVCLDERWVALVILHPLSTLCRHISGGEMCYYGWVPQQRDASK